MEAPNPSKEVEDFQSTLKARGRHAWIEGETLLFEHGSLGLEKTLC